MPAWRCFTRSDRHNLDAQPERPIVLDPAILPDHATRYFGDARLFAASAEVYRVLSFAFVALHELRFFARYRIHFAFLDVVCHPKWHKALVRNQPSPGVR